MGNTCLRRTACIALLLGAVSVQAQMPAAKRFQLGGEPVERPTSNYINDILVADGFIYAGSGNGVLVSGNRGASWELTNQDNGIGKGGISAIALRNDTLWVATAYDTTTDAGDYEAGGGLAWSPDRGATWHWIPQPVDSRDETGYYPTTTNIQNITYDIALTDSAVWIASFGGGLRRSVDNGASWQVVTVDGYPFDAYGRLTHRVFAVYYDGEAVWVGSAGGIHRTLDRGRSWTTFDYTQENGISGNFVVAIGHQDLPGGKRIWAATIEALDEGEERAVSYTDDGGLTWNRVLEGEFTHNFGFDPVSKAVYAATDNGLFKSEDGTAWFLFPRILDGATGESIYTSEFTSAAVEADQTLWAGTVDGMAFTGDNGFSWTVIRAYQPAGTAGEPDTYAYPNPFSPMRDNTVGSDGFVRFQYRLSRSGTVSVTVFDFAMQRVRNLVSGAQRDAGDRSEAWNGRNDLGDLVANGVYFYRIETGGKTFWGKVLIVN
ncbi:hypothetical protein JXO52_14490 [bacterium]|nr:hypothetical protein [bacterium]